VEEVCGGNLAAFTEKNVEQLDRTLGGGFDFKIVPGAAGAESFGEMQELARDSSAVISTCFTAAASREESSAGRFCGEVAQESRDFRVGGEPIEAQFDGSRGKQGLGKLARHRFRIAGSDYGADFVSTEHR
jgi:hypothetical protein